MRMQAKHSCCLPGGSAFNLHQPVLFIIPVPPPTYHPMNTKKGKMSLILFSGHVDIQMSDNICKITLDSFSGA